MRIIHQGDAIADTYISIVGSNRCSYVTDKSSGILNGRCDFWINAQAIIHCCILIRIRLISYKPSYHTSNVSRTACSCAYYLVSSNTVKYIWAIAYLACSVCINLTCDSADIVDRRCDSAFCYTSVKNTVLHSPDNSPSARTFIILSCASNGCVNPTFINKNTN